MFFSEEGIKKAVEIMFIDYGFELPMSWAMIGINGTFLIGRIELSIISKKIKVTVIHGKANRLRFPINAMFVDAKGKVAQVTFKRTGNKDEVPSMTVLNEKKGEGLIS